MSNWITIELDDRLLPNDGDLVAWKDFHDKEFEGVYIKAEKLFKKDHFDWAFADDVDKWKLIEHAKCEDDLADIML